MHAPALGNASQFSAVAKHLPKGYRRHDYLYLVSVFDVVHLASSRIDAANDLPVLVAHNPVYDHKFKSDRLDSLDAKTMVLIHKYHIYIYTYLCILPYTYTYLSILIHALLHRT